MSSSFVAASMGGATPWAGATMLTAASAFRSVPGGNRPSGNAGLLQKLSAVGHGGIRGRKRSNGVLKLSRGRTVTPTTFGLLGEPILPSEARAADLAHTGRSRYVISRSIFIVSPRFSQRP